MFERRLITVGGSKAVVIPKSQLDLMDWHARDIIILAPLDRKTLILSTDLEITFWDFMRKATVKYRKPRTRKQKNTHKRPLEIPQ